jgi:hypothetical protein
VIVVWVWHSLIVAGFAEVEQLAQDSSFRSWGPRAWIDGFPAFFSVRVKFGRITLPGGGPRVHLGGW